MVLYAKDVSGITINPLFEEGKKLTPVFTDNPGF